MKIDPEQIAALQRQSLVQKPASSGTTDSSFGDMLAQEVEKVNGAASSQVSATPLPSMSGMNPLLQSMATVSGSDTSSTGQTLMENVEGLLDDWEKYADSLNSAGSGSSNLREAYGQLEKISTDVQTLKGNWPAEGGEQLRSVVDEMEIMSATEKIKFNRGDYL